MTPVATLAQAGLPTGQVTLTQWEDLEPPTGYYLELHDGELVLLARSRPIHMNVSHQLTILLNKALPAQWRAVQEIEVVLWEVPLTIPVPDVTVFADTDANMQNPHMPVEQVLIVAEVVSPGTRTMDLKTKLEKYAKAGIAHYWIVDLEAKPPQDRFRAFALVDGVYQPRAVLAGDIVRISEPAELVFHLEDLTRR